MIIRVGIGGWNYEPWRGTFYPPGTTQKRELEYAAQHVTAIEINSTCYGSQKPASFANWAAAVPDGFKFSVKASRFTTNRKVLSVGAESIARFLGQGIDRLADRLGPLHWQFMATKKFERDDFARWMDLLPDKLGDMPLRHGLEVRHESFADPAFLDLARACNMAVVFADSDEFPCIAEQTADFTYARLQRSAEDHPNGYSDAAIDGWAAKANKWAQGNRDVFVFFIAGTKVRNPAAAQALIARL